MTDLSAPEVQSDLKKLQRTTIATNVMMGVVTVIAAAIAIWAATLKPWKDKSWAEIFFFVLIGILAAYFVFVFVWEMRLWRKIAATLRKFIGEGFAACNGLFKDTLPIKGGSAARFELSLASDKLIVMREGCAEYVQFDLSPIKSFTGACSCTVRFATEYIRDYCALAAKRGEITEAALTDRIRQKPREYIFVKDGIVLKDVSKSYFIKHEIMK